MLPPHAISFDFWNTLATPNPKFVIIRNNILHEFTNKSIPLEDIAILHRGAKAHLDDTARNLGIGYSTMDCVGSLAAALVDVSRIDEDETSFYRRVKGLMETIQDTALQYPPIILPETKLMIKILQSKGIYLSVTSNTNFISGRTIRAIVEAEGMKFNTYIFSDELLYAKPASEIFFMLLSQCACLDSEIIHVGDDPICDMGALEVGIRTLLIKDPADCARRVCELF